MITEKYTIYIDGSPLPGYTEVDLSAANRYVYRAEDAGKSTYVSVSSTNSAGSTVSVSNSVTIGVAPTISIDLATPVVGDPLTITPTISGLPVPTATYTLYYDEEPVVGYESVDQATIQSYVPTMTDLDGEIYVEGTVTNVLGASTVVSATKSVTDPKSFVLVIDTNLASPHYILGYGTPNNQFRFRGVEGQFDIYWGDGTYDLGEIGPITHTYPSPGVYEVRVSNWTDQGSGIVHSFGEDSYLEDARKVTEIKQWGTAQWTSMAYAFAGCNNMVGTFTDAPDLLLCSGLNRMFAGCFNFNSVIGDWDVGSATNMNGMFERAYSFNQNINNWNVSSVTDMANMFSTEGGEESYNQPLDKWDVSGVTDMSYMFAGCSSFNQPLNAWSAKTKNVTSMSGMFAYTSFNQDISSWDVSGVTDMSYMFEECPYNQPIGWIMGVSSVTSMAGMFSGNTSFNQDISWWDVSGVTDMGEMFYGATAFSYDITGWDVSSVTDMSYMFAYTSFNQDISSWDVSGVTYMAGMFENNTSFNQDISGWNTSAVTSMAYMFKGATSFSADITGWDVSGVQEMDFMFAGTNFNQDISGWNVGNVQRMAGMFQFNTSFNQDISGWSPSYLTNMEYMFEGATSFNQDISGWDVSNVFYFDSTFSGATSFNQNLGSWSLLNWVFGYYPTMFNMFDNCGMSEENYSRTLIGWANGTTVPINMTLGAMGREYTDTNYGGSPYNNAVDARSFLVGTQGWNIIGEIS